MFKFDKMNIQKPKYEQERINVITFDDIIGTNNGAFRRSGSVLQNLIFKNRHHWANVILTTQYIKVSILLLEKILTFGHYFRVKTKKQLLKRCMN